MDPTLHLPALDYDDAHKIMAIVAKHAHTDIWRKRLLDELNHVRCVDGVPAAAKHAVCTLADGLLYGNWPWNLEKMKEAR